MDVFYQLQQVPVHDVMNIKTRDEALHYPKGNISLGFCHHCGFITNLDFNPDLIGYSQDCEETQGYSSTFRAFLKNTAQQLIDKYDLHNKKIIEIGCGKGEFLHLLCRLGNNRGLGIDPAYVPERDKYVNNEVSFIKDYYSEEYADHTGDVVCCRMTLEHISEPHKFVSLVRRVIGDNSKTIVFIQVPDVVRILKECAFEDIYYEHCSYFSPGSLARLFRKCNFEILDLQTVYNGQYIVLEAKPSGAEVVEKVMLPQEENIESITSNVVEFQRNYPQTIKPWVEIIQSGKKIVLWGSGSKGVSFLTRLNVYGEIQYVVDINPYRQGTYMAGTGQRVVSPDFLMEYRPDIVIIMNPVYLDEIQTKIEEMKLNPEIMTLGVTRESCI
jgi:2-polyprenyl-3-methyl-5-hydroxy-6-metoxy-1,4-benzoquinol methylase